MTAETSLPGSVGGIAEAQSDPGVPAGFPAAGPSGSGGQETIAEEVSSGSPAAPSSAVLPGEKLNLDLILQLASRERETPSLLIRDTIPALVAALRTSRARCSSLERENTRLREAHRRAVEHAHAAATALEAKP